MVRLEPLTAMRWVRSVARNASRRSSGTRPVSPTTRAGSNARASASSPSEAVRRPARNSPAIRWRRLGSPVTTGGPGRAGRRTAAWGPPGSSGGASRPVSRSRVEGSSPRHRSPSARSGTGTISSTGVRVRTAAPDASATPTIRPSTSSEGGRPDSSPAVPPGCRTGRASPVTSTSAVTRACRPASSGTGPRWRSAPCSPAEAAPAAAQSRAAATQSLVRRTPGTGAFARAREDTGPLPEPLRRPAPDRPRPRIPGPAGTPPRPAPSASRPPHAPASTHPAPSNATPTTPHAHPGPTPTSSAAAPHAATAGTANRRSTGPRSPTPAPRSGPARRRPSSPRPPGPSCPSGSSGSSRPPPGSSRPPASRRPPNSPNPANSSRATSSPCLPGPPPAAPPPPLTAAPAPAGPRSAGRRCPVPRGVDPPSGSRRSRCGRR